MQLKSPDSNDSDTRNKFTSSPQLSPDGKLLAAYFREEQLGSPWRIMIAPFEGGQPIKTFDAISPVDNVALGVGVAWAPDGRSIYYVSTRDGTANLYSQPIDDGSAKQLTKFTEQSMGGFSFSRDGKTIVFTRNTLRSDVVLIREFR